MTFINSGKLPGGTSSGGGEQEIFVGTDPDNPANRFLIARRDGEEAIILSKDQFAQFVQYIDVDKWKGGKPGQYWTSQVDGSSNPADFGWQDLPAFPATEFFAEPAVEAQLDQWITLAPDQVDSSFVYDASSGGINSPADAAFAISVVLQLSLVEAFHDADVLFRVVTNEGVLAASSQRISASKTPLVHFHDVFTASKDTQFFVQVRPETTVDIETVQMRIGTVRVPAVSSLLKSVREPFNEALGAPPLSGDIIVLPQTLGGARNTPDLSVETHGTELTLNGDRVALPRQGRLYRVTGDVPKAQTLKVHVHENGYNTDQWPQVVDAKITKTGGRFDGKTGGSRHAPGLIYTQLSTAKLSVEVGGSGETTGGRLTLTDVTPYDYIGSTIHFDDAEVVLQQNGHINSATSVAPITTMDVVADHRGRVFLLSKLPTGIYKVSGEVRVTGDHRSFRIHTAYKSWYADIPQPMMVRKEGNDTIYTVLFYTAKNLIGPSDIEGLFFSASGKTGDKINLNGTIQVKRMHWAYDPSSPTGASADSDPFPGYTLTVPRQTITDGYLKNLSVKEAVECLPPFIPGVTDPTTWVEMEKGPWHGYREFPYGALWDAGTAAQAAAVAAWRWNIRLESFNGGLTKLELHEKNRRRVKTATNLVKGDSSDWYVGPVVERPMDKFYEGLIQDNDGIAGFDFGMVFIGGTAGVEVEGEIHCRQVNSFPPLM